MARRRRHGPALLTAVVLGLVTALGGLPAALGQGTAWECAPPAAATVPAGATPAVAAEPVAFPEAGGELTVFAAASLTDAFTEIQADLAAANPDLSITYNFAGSQALVTQLTEGAGADVFASASTSQMTAAQDAGVIAGEPVAFAHNLLAVVVPADNPASLASAADLGQEGLRLVLAQPEVPVGNYSRQAACLMAADTGTYGDDFAAWMAANVVSEEEDVRDVLAKVQLGEADAGIVYATDAAIAGDDVQIIEIPEAVNVIATYPVAPVTGGDPELSAAFISYLLSPEGQETLASYGFAPVP